MAPISSAVLGPLLSPPTFPMGQVPRYLLLEHHGLPHHDACTLCVFCPFLTKSLMSVTDPNVFPAHTVPVVEEAPNAIG